MKSSVFALTLPVLLTLSLSACRNDLIMKNASYGWHNDRIVQGEFTGVAESPLRIVSDLGGDTLVWEVKNDLSPLPKLSTPFLLEEAVYNMSLDEMLNAVEPDSTLRTGLSWGGVWTRDVSYSTILSMAYMQPRAAMISLLCKVGRTGMIIQDTGTGGAWPCSSDREIWTVAAWELYKVTGDRNWLDTVYPVVRKSIETDMKTLYDPETGLVRGESSFIDWREQSYPEWMEPADIYDSKCLGTNMVHYAALLSASQMARLSGDEAFAQECDARAAGLKEAINENLWMEDKGYYAQFIAGRADDLKYTKSETLGQALSILYGVAEGERAERLSQSMPVVDFGAPVFWPWIPDIPPYHNRAVWPFVQSFWLHASARTGNEAGVLHGIGSLYRAAAMYATNKENFVADSGDWKGTQINSSNMLWSLSGSLSVTFRVLMGMSYTAESLEFAPVVPRRLAAERKVEDFPYRDAVLDITVSGWGDGICSFKVDGVEQENHSVPSALEGRHSVEIVLNGSFRKDMKINMQPGLTTLPEPAVTCQDGVISWACIDGAAFYEVYAGGVKVLETEDVSCLVTPGWNGDVQVVAVSADGVPSFPSEPVNIAETVCVTIGDRYLPEISVSEYGKGVRILEAVVDVPEGEWAISWNYANGNGDVTTDRKCALRTLYVDGERVDICVFPQRGVDAWDDWGWTSPVFHTFTEGKHILTLRYEPENENMHIDVNDFAVKGLKLYRTRR